MTEGEENSSFRRVEVKVRAIGDSPNPPSSIVKVVFTEGHKEVIFRFLLGCGAVLGNGQLESVAAQYLASRRDLLLKLDGIFLVDSSLEDLGGVPLLYSEFKKRCHKEASPVTNHQTSHVQNNHRMDSSSNDEPADGVNDTPESKFPTIYCTEPVFKFGKLELYDTIHHLEKSSCQVRVKNIFQPAQTSSISSTNLSGSFTFDAIDDSFDNCIRLQYSENVFLKKKFRRKKVEGKKIKVLENSNRRQEEEHFSEEDGTSSNGGHDDYLEDDFRLTIRCYPNGINLGGSVWYLWSDSLKSSLLLGHQFTTKGNWFFDGLQVQQLPRPPSLVLTSCPFYLPNKNCPSGPSLSSTFSIASSAYVPALSPLSESQSGKILLDLCIATLKSGGSVLIPVSISTFCIKLFLMFESTWTALLKIFPIIFVSSTGGVLLDFAKTSLDWMSQPIRNRFAMNRENPFHLLRHIHFVTSPEEALRIGPGIPKVFISTPSSLELGHTQSVVIFTSTVNQFESTLFPHLSAHVPTRAASMTLCIQDLQNRIIPTDKLYALYLKEQQKRNEKMSLVSSSDQIIERVSKHATLASESGVAPPQTSSTSKDLENLLGEFKVKKTRNHFQSVSEFGLPFTIEKSATLAGKGSIEEMLWNSGISTKRLKEMQENGLFDESGVEVVVEDEEHIQRDDQLLFHEEETKKEMLPPWRQQLRIWFDGEDPTETVPISWTITTKCRAVDMSDLSQTSSKIQKFNCQAFGDWVLLSLRCLNPKNIILLPPLVHPCFIKALMRPLCDDLADSTLTVCTAARQNQTTATPIIKTAKIFVDWNEISIVSSQRFWDALKLENLYTFPGQKEETKVTNNNNQTIDLSEMNKKKTSLTMLGYFQLIKNTTPAMAKCQSKSNTTKEDINIEDEHQIFLNEQSFQLDVLDKSDSQMAADESDNNNFMSPCHRRMSSENNLLHYDDFVDHKLEKYLSNDDGTSISHLKNWIALGHYNLKDLYKFLSKIFPNELLVMDANKIFLSQKTALTLTRIHNKQILQIDGGLDPMTLCIKQMCDNKKLHQFGSLFTLN